MPPKSWDQLPATKWDSWDKLSYLGLETLQPRAIRNKAPGIDRGVAHARGPDNKYLHPEQHRIRSACVFPFLNRQPQPHQLDVVMQYFSQVYSTDSKINKVNQYILADETGLGKTTEMALLTAFALWIKQDGPTAAKSGVCQKTHLNVLAGHLTEKKRDHVPQRVRIASAPNTDGLLPVLIVSVCGMMDQLYAELVHILDKDRFQVVAVRPQKTWPERKAFYKSLKDRKRTHVILFPWTSLAPEAGLVADLEERHDSAIDNSVFGTRWSHIFFDEAHIACNPETALFRWGSKLAAKGNRVFAVTATPIWNSPLDLLNIARLIGLKLKGDQSLGHGALPHFTLSEFKEKEIGLQYGNIHPKLRRLVRFYCHLENQRRKLQKHLKGHLQPLADAVDGEDSDLQDMDLHDPWALIGLVDDSPKMQPIKDNWKGLESKVVDLVLQPMLQLTQYNLIRRTATVSCLGCPILDIPKLAIKEIPIVLNAAQRESYEAVVRLGPRAYEMDPQQVQDYLVRFRAGRRANKDWTNHVLPKSFECSSRVGLLRLLQYDIDSAKVVKLIQMLKQRMEQEAHLPPEQQSKILIYLSWIDTEVLGSILQQLDSAGLPAMYVNSKVHEDDRNTIYKAFQKDASHKSYDGKNKSRILIISRCSSTSINLHRANMLFFLDHPWTHASREQIIGRMHRMGQTRTTEVFSLVVRDTIDCGMRFTQLRKSRFAKRLDATAAHVLPGFTESGAEDKVVQLLRARKRRREERD